MVMPTVGFLACKWNATLLFSFSLADESNAVSTVFFVMDGMKDTLLLLECWLKVIWDLHWSHYMLLDKLYASHQ